MPDCNDSSDFFFNDLLCSRSLFHKYKYTVSSLVTTDIYHKIHNCHDFWLAAALTSPDALTLAPLTSDLLSETLLTRNCRISPQDERSSRSAGLGAIQTNMTGSRPSLGGGLGGSMSASGGLSGTGLSGGLSTSGLSGATAMSTAGGAQAMPHFDCDGDITPPFSSINRPYLWVCPKRQVLSFC